MSLVVDEHREYLSDPVRIAAFRRALAVVVRPGDVVADLASGTGILGLLACQAGARRVYAIEETGLVELARQVAAANQLADRITVIHGHSTLVALPEPVDVIVCDQIGHFGFEAGLIQDGSDARDRWLKPGGRMVPARVDLCVAPIEAPGLHAQVAFWSERPAGFDFEPARRWAANTGYPVRLAPDALLGDEAVGASIDTSRMTPAPFTVEARLRIARDGTLHGIGGWFSAALAPGVMLTNGPTAAERVTRRNVFFPIDRPVAVGKGEVVSVAMHVRPADLLVTWTVDVAGRARFRHSTLNGMLVSRDELRRMDPRLAPRLTRRGTARLDVLALCDGDRPLAAIERALFERHPDLFRTPAEAAVFVAEVVTRYSE